MYLADHYLIGDVFVDDMKMKSPIRRLFVAFAALFTGLSATSGAQATTYYWDIQADAGSFGPVILGQDISLDACGSRLINVQFPSFGTGLCDIVNINLFSVNWFARNVTTGAFQWLTGGLGTNQNPDLSTIPVGTAATNRQTTTSTGAGTFFNSAGTYAIGVYVAGTRNANQFFTETTSSSTSSSTFLDTGRFGPDYAASLSDAFNNNGTLNDGAVYGVDFTITAPVSVPEPMQLLMLFPALLLIARRERKRLA